NFGWTGTKGSSAAQIFVSCTVLVVGLPVSFCTYLGVDVDRREVPTIEGTSDSASLARVQQAFDDAGAIHCGYCNPCLFPSVTALLDSTTEPTLEEAKHYLDGNICRCTGYEQILEAVLLAAQAQKGADG